jgi:hypothetical protein
LRCPDRIDSLNIHLDEFREAILVQVEDEVMDEVETIADNDEWELIGELGFLEEVFDLLRIIEVTLSANAFDLTDLAGASGSLDVLKVNLGILAEVDN